MAITYEKDDVFGPEQKKQLEEWASMNRIKQIEVNELGELLIRDSRMLLTYKTWVKDNGTYKIPFKIAQAKNLSITSIQDNIENFKECFPKSILGDIMVAAGKMPAGLTDLSFLSWNDTFPSDVVITANKGLLSLNGCPQEVENLEISRNGDLASLSGISNTIGTSLTIVVNPKITSLHNIHKHIKHVERIVIDGCIQSNILGLLMIDGLIEVGLDHAGRGASTQLRDAIKCINKYLESDVNTTSMIECHEELLELGLKQYARL